MTDFIERQALLLKLKEKEREWRGTFTADGMNMSINVVEQAPAADVAPVVRWRCEYCKDGKSVNGAMVMGDNHGGWIPLRHCPNCGTKMAKEEK